jgi:hypothetical protein
MYESNPRLSRELKAILPKYRAYVGAQMKHLSNGKLSDRNIRLLVKKHDRLIQEHLAALKPTRVTAAAILTRTTLCTDDGGRTYMVLIRNPIGGKNPISVPGKGTLISSVTKHDVARYDIYLDERHNEFVAYVTMPEQVAPGQWEYQTTPWGPHDTLKEAKSEANKVISYWWITQGKKGRFSKSAAPPELPAAPTAPESVDIEQVEGAPELPAGPALLALPEVNPMSDGWAMLLGLVAVGSIGAAIYYARQPVSPPSTPI